MRSQEKTSPRTSGAFVLFVVLLFAAVSGLVLGAFALAERAWKEEFPDPGILRTHYPVVTPVAKRVKGKPSFTVRLSRQRPADWVSLKDVSPLAVAAVVISEDWAYFSHRGYDANQIREAIRHDLETGSFARGASTITQQVVKNVFLGPEKTLWRKVREFLLATRLDRDVGKRRVLEVYLNMVEWGPGVFGIGEASRHYFGTEPSNLGPREGAFLAMLLPSPVRYSQSFRQKKLTPYARKTVNSILRKMSQAGHLSDDEAEAAIRARMIFENQEPDSSEDDSAEAAEAAEDEEDNSED